MRALVGQGFAEAIIQIITTWTSVVINSKTVKCIHTRKSKVMTQHHLIVILMVMIHFSQISNSRFSAQNVTAFY